MNKKLILIIGLVLIALLIIIFIPKSKQSYVETNEIVSSQDDALIFNPSSKTIFYQDEETGASAEIAKTNTSELISAELNQNKTQLLFSEPTVSEDQVIDENVNVEAEVLSVQVLGQEKAPLTIQNVFSPIWIDNDTIVYQDISQTDKSSIVLFSTTTGKEEQRITLASPTQLTLQILNQTNILLSEYSSDIGDVKAQILNLSTEKFTEFTTGYGFKARTQSGSELLGYQTSESYSGSASTKIINWKTQKQVLALNVPVAKIAWDANNVYYIEGTTLMKYELSSGAKTNLKDSVGSETSILGIKSGNLILLTGNATKNVKI